MTRLLLTVKKHTLLPSFFKTLFPVLHYIAIKYCDIPLILKIWTNINTKFLFTIQKPSDRVS